MNEQNMKSSIESILSSYQQISQNQSFKSHSDLDRHFNTIKSSISGMVGIEDHSSLIFKSSYGQGNWARIPWIAILDERETKSTQSGIYCVFLFRMDMTGVYITFNQGVTKPKVNSGNNLGHDVIAENIKLLRPKCGHLEQHGFNIDNQIDLRISGGLGKQYEGSTIAYKLYETGNIPDDVDIENDVKLLLQVYKSYVASSKSEDEEVNLQSSPIPSFELIRECIVNKNGIRISDRDLRRYHVSLATRGFVILSGISGSGKTWLANAYAEAVQASQLLVSVAPNWTTNEDLLGYFNPLTSTYHDTAFSRFLKESSEEYSNALCSGVLPKPYHLILDEMNLARVEYYFAKFLSAMEIRARENTTTIELGPNYSIQLTPNLKFIGTVNVDETTVGFADKVFDRAQLIELGVSRELLKEHLGEKPYGQLLIEVWDCVREVSPFAYRILDDIESYVEESSKLDVVWEVALDEQIIQKILPKVKGTESQVGIALQNLIDLTQDKFPMTKSKSTAMLDRFQKNGFTSFF